MLSWIVRILILAAPIAAPLVSRDALNFGLVQTLVAVMLIVAVDHHTDVWRRRKIPSKPKAAAINTPPKNAAQART